MYKLIFELLTDPLGLPIAWYWEYTLLAILNEIAFQIAWNVSPGGRFGREIHWAVRIPTFIALWAVTYGVIVAVKWICANWMLVLSILGIAIVVAIVATILVLHRRKKYECT